MLLANFSTEIKAVETAASRLFESTVDFPNAAFVEIVTAVCNLLEKQAEPSTPNIDSRPQSPQSGGSTLKAAVQHRRVLSVSTAAISGPNQEDQFALAKLGDLASINLERLLNYPPDVSGWAPLTAELIATLSSTSVNPPSGCGRQKFLSGSFLKQRMQSRQNPRRPAEKYSSVSWKRCETAYPQCRRRTVAAP